MKHIKNLKKPAGIECMSGEFSIYEMENEAELSAANGFKYLVNRTFSDFAMREMDSVTDLLPHALRESEYVYGVGFCNTVRECELFYMAACFQAYFQTLRYANKRYIEEMMKHSQAMDALESANLGCSGTGKGWGVEDAQQ